MYMDIGEDGEAMDNTAQRVCWFGADVLLRNECEESWRCLPKRFNAAQYESCINDCLAGSIAAGLDERYAQIEATSCPSRQGFCDPSNTDYKVTTTCARQPVYKKQAQRQVFWLRILTSY
jgi:hypothetical protein